MNDRHTEFLDMIRTAVGEALADPDASLAAKVCVLTCYSSQIDGAIAVVEGDDGFVIECCKLQREVHKMRDELK